MLSAFQSGWGASGDRNSRLNRFSKNNYVNNSNNNNNNNNQLGSWNTQQAGFGGVENSPMQQLIGARDRMLSHHQQQQVNYLHKIERARMNAAATNAGPSMDMKGLHDEGNEVSSPRGSGLGTQGKINGSISYRKLGKKLHGSSGKRNNPFHNGISRPPTNQWENSNNSATGNGNRASGDKSYEGSSSNHLPQISSPTPSSSVAAAALPLRSNGKRSQVMLSTHQSKKGSPQITNEQYKSTGVTSIEGTKPNNPNWINQDNFFVLESFDEMNLHFFCVLDGHGEVGHLVSRRCREVFKQYIKASNIDMKRAFNMMQNDLLNADFDTRCSGATCVMVMYNSSKGKLVTMNCGDSRAIVARRTGTGKYMAIPLSNDHKPDDPEERRRILNCGGHVGCRQVLVSHGPRGPITKPAGPCRVWYQHEGDTLGLAMSRSMGDTVAHKVGVSAEPEMLDHDVLTDIDEFLILATDGVWDVIDNNSAISIVQSYIAKMGSNGRNWSPLEASNWICKVARGRWEKLSPMVDDITAVVVRLSDIPRNTNIQSNDRNEPR